MEPPAPPAKAVTSPATMVMPAWDVIKTPWWPALELMSYNPLIRWAGLASARTTLDRLKVDLLDTDERLRQVRLKLAAIWCELSRASKATQDRAESLATKSGREADDARVARDGECTKADRAAKHCADAEAHLEGSPRGTSRRMTSRLAKRRSPIATPCCQRQLSTRLRSVSA